ncbi:MAG: DUF1996 domain-containing protein [Kineosporiaceae bacterium]
MSTPRPTAFRPSLRAVGATTAAAALSILATGCQSMELPVAPSSASLSPPAQLDPGSLPTSAEPGPSASGVVGTATSAPDVQPSSGDQQSSDDTRAGATGSTGAGTPAGSEGSIFVVRCETSHSAPDDPIVYPGEPGASHDHTFFGNTSTDAFSTTESLMSSADTSCDVPADLSGYWFPTVYQNGEPLDVEGSVYYLDIDSQEPLTAPPDGLRVLAGADMTQADDMDHEDMDHGDDATDSPGSEDAAESMTVDGMAYWGFTCQDEHTELLATPPADCTEEEPIAMRVNFPECWDGVNLDSDDHRSHLAYRGYDREQGGLACPATHPVEIPRLRLNVFLGTTDPTGITLSSGDVSTLHADVFVAWEGEALEDLVGQLNDGTVEPFPGTTAAAGTQ